MELRFGEKEEKLRLEVRDFLRKNNGVETGEGNSGFGGGSDNSSSSRKASIRACCEGDRPGVAEGIRRPRSSIYEQMVFNEEFG